MPVNSLVLCTYNILANKYAVSGNHSYCLSKCLDWSGRAPRLLQEIERHNADVIFLQEVEEPVFQGEWLPHFRGLGFDGSCHMRNNLNGSEPKEGSVLFWRTSLFDVLSQHTFQFKDHLNPEAPSDNEAVQKAAERHDGGVTIVAKHRETGVLCLLSCVHLFWDPKWPDVKALQAEALCRHIQAVLTKCNLPIDSTPVVAAGDFNSVWRKYSSDQFDVLPPGEAYRTSGVYQLMTEGHLPTSNHHHPSQCKRTGTQVGPLSSGSLSLSSAHMMNSQKEPVLTTVTSSFAAAIDFIMVSPHFRTIGCAPMPYEGLGVDSSNIEGVLENFPACPNDVQPSDHLSVACSVELIAHP